jgi:predicted nucleic-acid-binding Zn-ribbon protein
MKKSRFSEEQIAYTLKLAEAEYVNKDVAVFEKKLSNFIRVQNDFPDNFPVLD